jgi:hypothetical protein
VGTQQADRRRQQRRRGPAQGPRLSKDELAWIRARTKIGWAIDDFLKTDPPIEVRRAVRHLEEALRIGDRAAGLL